MTRSIRPIAYSAYHYRTAPAGSATAVLWDTTTHGRMTQGVGIHRVRLDVAHDQDGTLELHRSDNDGASWEAVSSAAVTTAATTSKADLIVEPYLDYRIRWVNGATPQTYFEADLSFQYDRSPTGDLAPGPPPGENVIQDDLNSGGAGVNQDIQDDLGGGGNITDP